MSLSFQCLGYVSLKALFSVKAYGSGFIFLAYFLLHEAANAGRKT